MDNKTKNNYPLIFGLQLLFVLLIFKIIFLLRKQIPSYVNCWFCNRNSWVSYTIRNSWTCKKCEQYNGFSKDGGYNKQIDTNVPSKANYNASRRNVPTSNNGLCYKCNTNQQLKIMQLSNFIPMNEKNFDSEVDAFKIHLEKVYQLCSSCKKYVKEKLQKEKGSFLGVMLMQSRMLKKNTNDKIAHCLNFLKNAIFVILKVIALLVFIYSVTRVFINIDLYISKKTVQMTMRRFKSSYIHIKHSVLHIENDSIFVIMLHFIQTYFIMLQDYIVSLHSLSLEYINNRFNENILNVLNYNYMSEIFSLELMILTAFTLQLTLHISEFSMTLRYFINDILWALSLYVASASNENLDIVQIILAVILIFYSPQERENETKINKNTSMSKKIKNLSNTSSNTSNLDDDDDDLISDDSDMEVMSNMASNYYSTVNVPSHSSKYLHSQGRSQFGSLRFSNPSCCSTSMCDNSTTYGFNAENNYFSKPFPGSPEMQKKFSNTRSELDESISELNLGNQNKQGAVGNSVFSTRQYNCASPNLFMPSPAHMRRPVLSPSRFVHGTQQSWVAGGYWGAGSPRQLYNIHQTSRSSSQSSGFESLASSAYQRNVNSFPPSREDSVSSECNKKYENCLHQNGLCNNNSPNHTSAFQNFYPQNSPIFPNLRSNESVLIPSPVPYNNNVQAFNRERFGSTGSLFLKTNNPNSFVPVHNPQLNE